MYDSRCRGSEDAVRLWDSAETVVTCRRAYPEARAALAASRRARRITAEVLDDVITDLHDLFEELNIIEVRRGACSRAGDLAAAHGLRGYDAVAAFAVDDDDLVIATWDHDLCQAADAMGQLTAPPPAAR